MFQELHTWLTLAFGFEFQKESHVTCRVCACSCVLTCVHMMKVWAAEGSEWSRCQTLTSCGFSCPSLRRYLKFDSDPQISHVAYICTEIPPRSIGCFEMDVNMNLFAIYLRPFGCLYSVTALQGHRRCLTCLGVQLWRPVYPITDRVCESEWKTKGWSEIAQYYQVCWHYTIKWNANCE